jgi:hypothetical protein
MDRHHIGRAPFRSARASLAHGGQPQPIIMVIARTTHASSGCGLDQRRFVTSMLSVPLACA